MTAPAPTAFDHVPRTRQGHFLLHFYAAVHHLIHYMNRLHQLAGTELDESFQRYPFLAHYLAEIQGVLPASVTGDTAARWWAREIATWEETVDEHLPLRAIDTLPGTDFSGRLALLCVGLVDEDSRFGTLFAHFQQPLAHRRPFLETVGQIIGAGQPGGDAWSLCRPLLEASLIEVTTPEAPRAEWVLRVPALLWDVLRGTAESSPAAWCRVLPPASFPLPGHLIFAEDFLERLAQVPPMLRSGRIGALILRGMQGSERREVLGAVARALGRGVIEYLPTVAKTGEGGEVDERQRALLGPLCTLSHSVPVLTYDLGPGETVELQPLSGYHGPVGLLLGQEGGIRGPLADQAFTLALPAPGASQRLRHWQQGLDGHAGPDLAAISERFHMPGGYIRQASTLAITQAALEQRQTVTLGDVRAACRTLNRQLLDSLATRQEAAGAWNQLVVNAMTATKLRELELRCRHRERLLEHLAPTFQAATSSGVRALFTGGSGTGKTLAAKILAAELGMDLYRVDLSAVVNKYIGETEKNLHRVLSRAEELDVILLLDEGDALLSNRTDVKSSNDRYANLETNYLLQRLENYQGIVVVTTNAGQYIDTAFQRRMDVVVHFTAPQVPERWRIWQLHLPDRHTVDPLYLEEIATRHALSGGQIRNAALHATLLALDGGGCVVRDAHLQTAVESEYRKAGALCPSADGMENKPRSGMAAFLDVLSYQGTTPPAL